MTPAELAKMAGISQEAVEEAVLIADFGSADLEQAVGRGELTLKEAVRVVRHRAIDALADEDSRFCRTSPDSHERDRVTPTP